MTALDALRAQAGLRDAMRKTHYQNMVNTFMDSRDRGVENISGPEWCAIQHQALTEAITFHVDGDMNPLIEWGYRTMPNDEFWQPSSLPTPNGFLLLAESHKTLDPLKDVMEWKAAAWREGIGPSDHGELKAGFWLDVYSSAEDMADYAAKRRDEVPYHYPDEAHLMTPRQMRTHARAISPLHLIHHAFFAWGDMVGPTGFSVVDDYAEVQNLLGNFTQVRAALIRDGEDILVANVSKWFFSLFTLMQQTIVGAERTSLPPAVKREFKKRIEPSVIVVKLRRQSGINRAEGESVVDWQARWVVRGHWRKQPYGSREDPEYRLTWIAPYIKGPESKPLIFREHVYSLTR